MSDPDFSNIVEGEFTAGTIQMRVASGNVSKHFGVFDLTGSGSGAEREFGQGRSHYRVSALGWLRVDGAFPKAIKSVADPVTGALISILHNVNLVVRIPLQDVTGSPDVDGIIRVLTQNPIIHGQAEGSLLRSEVPFGASGVMSALSMLIGATALTGEAVLENIVKNTNFREGGGTPVNFAFRYSKTLSSVPAIVAVRAFDAVVRTDNGKQYSGSVVPNMIQLGLNYRAGSFIPLRISGPFNGAVAVDDVEGSSESSA